VIAHRDREDKGARTLGVEQAQDMTGQLRIGGVGRCGRAAQAFTPEELVKSQRRHRPVAAIKAAVERMQTDRPVARLPQPPDLRGDRRAGQRVVRVEAVVAERRLVDAGQHGELGARGVGAPGRHAEPAIGLAAGIVAGEKPRRQL
jgi:hypothetical protein